MTSAGRKLWDRACRFVILNWVSISCGAALEIGFAAFLLLTESNNWTTLPNLFFVLFSIYGISVLVRKRIPQGRESVLVILALAVAFRLTLLFSGPAFSFDIYRYIWDGKVAANGINPYLYPPDAPELSGLRDANWALVHHKFVRTGYPPLMEMLFEILYLTFDSVLSYKVTFFLFDLGAIAVIFLILKELKFERTNVMIYAWAPLPIIEISQTGHNDSIAVFLVLFSFLLLIRGRTCSSAVVMSLAVLMKLYPIFFAPILLKRWGRWGTAAFIALLAVFYLPYANIGLSILTGILYAVNTSYFNGSIFPFVTSFVEWTGLASNPGFVAEIIVYPVFGFLLLWKMSESIRKKASSLSLMKNAFLLTGAVLLMTRSFFAWYMIWMIPFLVFYSSLSWLLLSGTIFLGYVKYNALPPPALESVSPLTALAIDLVEYAPFYVILVYELLRHRIQLRKAAG